ncbi:hypothetical protein HPB52_018330 [Rhipicephalus sanguineus]|uniref:Fatty acid synthase n=1 Tax=Rhipicephalus sanguineus TaxID=34632 RepID=A0A9D4PKC5_RHISA|nr:hypothetical protein HPB52_018330 [Rhipicephalus sanguineus]
METGTIAANLHFKEPSTDIPSLHDGRVVVVDRPTPLDSGLVGISLQGIGGTNAHGIFEPNQGSHVDSLPREKLELPRLVLLAGRTKESLLSHAMLREKFGIDLIDLVTSAEPRNKKSIVSPVVAISAVQVALVDMLHALGLKPDGIVGHSLGEWRPRGRSGSKNALKGALGMFKETAHPNPQP